MAHPSGCAAFVTKGGYDEKGNEILDHRSAGCGTGGWMQLYCGGNDTEKHRQYGLLPGGGREIEGHTALPVLGQRMEVSCPFDLPVLAELEAEAVCRFDYTVYRVGIFENHAYILIAAYDTGYTAAASALDGAYNWMEEETVGITPEFQLDGFRFRTAEGENYPHEMLFVGNSDDTGEIAYIYFYDQDLDIVPQGAAALLRDCSGWNKVAGK